MRDAVSCYFKTDKRDLSLPSNMREAMEARDELQTHLEVLVWQPRSKRPNQDGWLHDTGDHAASREAKLTK